jgi:hypothetical protein
MGFLIGLAVSLGFTALVTYWMFLLLPIWLFIPFCVVAFSTPMYYGTRNYNG